MLARLKAIPGWLWAVVVGLAWLLWRQWAAAQRSAQIRAIETERRRIDREYQSELDALGDRADAERVILVRARVESQTAADGERRAITDAAARDQEAFAAHWARVMGRKP